MGAPTQSVSFKQLNVALHPNVYARISRIADATGNNEFGSPRLSEAHLSSIILASISDNEMERAVAKVYRFVKAKKSGASDAQADADSDEKD